MAIIDMHCHILPGVDDGSQSMRTTRKMLEIAAEEGITHMIATPHYKQGHRCVSPRSARELVKEVQAMSDEAGFGIKIYQGNEIMFYSEVEEAFKEGRFTTMNGSDYLLIEFYPDDDYTRIRNAVDTTRNMGLIPVIAHVERFLTLRKDAEKVAELKESGALIQINAASVAGEQGLGTKQFVKKLLKDEIVDFIGTDAHHYERRAPRMKKCAEYLYRKFDEEYADAVLFGNAIKYFGIKE